jgi:hypothetical protein
MLWKDQMAKKLGFQMITAVFLNHKLLKNERKKDGVQIFYWIFKCGKTK